MARRRLVAVVAIVLTVTCGLSATIGWRLIGWLQGGGAPTLRAEDVIGQWTAEDGGQLNLRSDGTFEARALPTKLVARPASGAVVNGDGHWRLVANPMDLDRSTELSLDFTGPTPWTPDGYSMRIQARMDDSELILYRFIGDPDLNVRYEFRRV